MLPITAFAVYERKMKMKKIGVLGAGTWGIALARMLTNNGNDVVVWSALPQEIDNLNSTRVHPNLTYMQIPDEMRFTKDLSEACTDKDIILVAVPSVFVRGTSKNAAPYVKNDQIIVDVAKGIEPDTLYTMTEIIKDEMVKAGKTEVKPVALSGPTHAEEVAKDMPTTIVSACEDLETAQIVQDVFMNTCMRVYTNTDVKGVELCGALKNVMALAAGISAGIGYGDNTKAALITRGMAEITRLGMEMGCDSRTFYGLAGIGDLIVTATSVHSRNNRAGMLIGEGVPAAEAVKQVGMVVEGINAIPAAMELAGKYNVDMPIIMAVNEIVNNGKSPKTAVMELMNRDKKNEYNKQH